MGTPLCPNSRNKATAACPLECNKRPAVCYTLCNTRRLHVTHCETLGLESGHVLHPGVICCRPFVTLVKTSGTKLVFVYDRNGRRYTFMAEISGRVLRHVELMLVLVYVHNGRR